MKTDLYTKTVLTIIAVSLAIIALRHSIPSAFAQSPQMSYVIICDPDNWGRYRFPDGSCAHVSKGQLATQ